MSDRQIWFLTGSQGLYGDDVLAQVATQSRRSPTRWPPRRHRRRGRGQAGAHRRGRHAPHDARRHLRRPRRRRHRVDAHLLPGQDVDRGARRAAQAAAAPAHPGRPRPALVDHRHGLHEPQPGRPRRPGVRLHPDPDAAAALDRRRVTSSDPVVLQRVAEWSRAAAAAAALRTHAASCASATTCATSPSPRATRSRPRSASASRSTPTGSTTSSRSSTRSPTPTVDALVAEYEDTYDVAPELRRGGERHESLRYGARIEAGLRQFLEAGGYTAFTSNFEDLGGLRQLPGLARAAADGRRLRLRRRGRLEDLGARAHASR